MHVFPGALYFCAFSLCARSDTVFDPRIKHTYVLDDPFDDPAGFEEPNESPVRVKPIEESIVERPDAETIDTVETRTAEEIEASVKAGESKARATLLEIVGDIPDADIAPPEVRTAYGFALP
jgi:peptidyl-prolyl cis-trans isomerase-like 4